MDKSYVFIENRINEFLEKNFDGEYETLDGIEQVDFFMCFKDSSKFMSHGSFINCLVKIFGECNEITRHTAHRFYWKTLRAWVKPFYDYFDYHCRVRMVYDGWKITNVDLPYKHFKDTRQEIILYLLERWKEEKIIELTEKEMFKK